MLVILRGLSRVYMRMQFNWIKRHALYWRSSGGKDFIFYKQRLHKKVEILSTEMIKINRLLKAGCGISRIYKT